MLNIDMASFPGVCIDVLLKNQININYYVSLSVALSINDCIKYACALAGENTVDRLRGLYCIFSQEAIRGGAIV